MSPTLLIIDDEESIRQSLGYVFKGKGYEVHEAGNAGAGISLAQDLQPDIIILDYKLPDATGLEVLDGIKVTSPDAIVIMLTAYGNIPNAVEAMRKGAFDYLTKPVDLNVLEITVDRAVEMQRLKKENRFLKEFRYDGQGEGIIGGSTELHKIILMLNMLAENPDTTVLIEGESGTGKELAARTIHRLSLRKDKPFVDINCASLSENLLESELFGHERGAFTDAKETKKGLLEIADGGTLFLDEIGELAQALQPKLLRVLESKTFRRVGGTRDIKVDVRIMAATNRSLSEAVVQKAFREDLYYRLAVMPVTMPPLRERDSDVIMLARHFLSKMSAGVKKKISDISPECETFFRAYRWPGNVRELKNVIERAVILSPGSLITPEHLPRELIDNPAAKAKKQPGCVSATLDEVERRHIAEVLEHINGNQSQAARILGISRSTLIIKLKKYSLL